MRRGGPVGTPQNRSERDSFATLYEDRLAQLNAVENGLCFGRLDRRAGGRGSERDGAGRPERAPLLRRSPRPVRRAERAAARRLAGPGRAALLPRHAGASGRRGPPPAPAQPGPRGDRRRRRRLRPRVAVRRRAQHAERRGRAARRAVGEPHRPDGRHRRDHPGRAGPGHPLRPRPACSWCRAAPAPARPPSRCTAPPTCSTPTGSGSRAPACSSSGRRRCSSATSGRCCPRWARPGVLLATPEELLADVEVSGPEAGEDVARLKGDLRMAEVLAAAVADRQRPLPFDVTIPFEGAELRAHPAQRERGAGPGPPRAPSAQRGPARVRPGAGRAAGRARRCRSPRGREPGDEPYVRRAHRPGRGVPDGRRPRCGRGSGRSGFLRDLFADRGGARPRVADGILLEPTRSRCCCGTGGAPWTAADVPLLDEAAELLGDPDAAAARRAGAAARARPSGPTPRACSRSGPAPTDELAGEVDAELLAERFRDTGPDLTVAERAAGDREWTFGHVIVDEAQELSPMTWRLLMRRCPSRSFTLVGDVAADRGRRGRIVLGARCSTRSSPGGGAPRSCGSTTARRPRSWTSRRTCCAPSTPRWSRRPRCGRAARRRGRCVVPRGRWPAELCRRWCEPRPRRSGTGPSRCCCRRALRRARAPRRCRRCRTSAAVRGTSSPTGSRSCPCGEAKGLEFDAVVVVDPAAVLAGSHRGANDLYVAVTRATKRLTVVTDGELPAVLHRLAAD